MVRETQRQRPRNQLEVIQGTGACWCLEKRRAATLIFVEREKAFLEDAMAANGAAGTQLY